MQFGALAKDFIAHLLETSTPCPRASTLSFSLKTQRPKKLLASMVRLTCVNMSLLLVFKLLCGLTSCSTMSGVSKAFYCGVEWEGRKEIKRRTCQRISVLST